MREKEIGYKKNTEKENVKMSLGKEKLKIDTEIRHYRDIKNSLIDR